MTRKEFQAAFAIAQNKSVSLHEETLFVPDIFDGFGLPSFRPVACTLRQLAALIRWQAYQFNDNWSAEALTEIQTAGRVKFTIMPGGDIGNQVTRAWA